jgi:hypothetical protein
MVRRDVRPGGRAGLVAPPAWLACRAAVACPLPPAVPCLFPLNRACLFASSIRPPCTAAARCPQVCLEWWAYELCIFMSGWLPHPTRQVAAMGVMMQVSGLAYMLPMVSSLGGEGRGAGGGGSAGGGAPGRAWHAHWWDEHGPLFSHTCPPAATPSPPGPLLRHLGAREQRAGRRAAAQRAAQRAHRHRHHRVHPGGAAHLDPAGQERDRADLHKRARGG